MNQNKTKPTKKSVEAFITSIADSQKRQDSQKVLELLHKVTKLPPKLWGESIVGFGEYHYRYKSGREGDFFRIGFAPRKQNLTIYLMDGMANSHEDNPLFTKLGKFSTGKACLYIKRLDQVDLGVLEEILAKSFQGMEELIQKTEGWH